MFGFNSENYSFNKDGSREAGFVNVWIGDFPNYLVTFGSRIMEN